jgi:hypothetical protein
LASVVDDLQAGSATVRLRLEDAIRRVLRARLVQVRELPSGVRSGPAFARDVISVDLPQFGRPRPSVLEAHLDHRSGRAHDEWDLHTLRSAANLTGLVLEFERLRLATRANTTVRPCRDSAAPLIGRTHGMQLLRERIERVASTDFTVLVEGPCDPQQHAINGC